MLLQWSISVVVFWGIAELEAAVPPEDEAVGVLWDLAELEALVLSQDEIAGVFIARQETVPLDMPEGRAKDGAPDTAVGTWGSSESLRCSCMLSQRRRDISLASRLWMMGMEGGAWSCARMSERSPSKTAFSLYARSSTL